MAQLKIQQKDYERLKEGVETVLQRYQENFSDYPVIATRSHVWNLYHAAYTPIDREYCQEGYGHHWLDELKDTHKESAMLSIITELYSPEHSGLYTFRR